MNGWGVDGVVQKGYSSYGERAGKSNEPDSREDSPQIEEQNLPTGSLIWAAKP